MEYVKDRYNLENVVLSLATVVANRITIPKSHVANFMCLIMKQYCYRQRCLKLEPNFRQLIGIINQVENIEKYLAIKNHCNELQRDLVSRSTGNG